MLVPNIRSCKEWPSRIEIRVLDAIPVVTVEKESSLSTSVIEDVADISLQVIRKRTRRNFWPYHVVIWPVIEATKPRLGGKGIKYEPPYVRAAVLGTVQEEKVTPARLKSPATTLAGTGSGSGSGSGTGCAREEATVRRIAIKGFIIKHQ